MSNLEKTKESIKPVPVGLVQKLRDHMADPEPEYPHDLINKIVEQREQTTDGLLAIADEYLQGSMRDVTIEKWRLSMVALFILSKFREKRAFEYMVRLCKIPPYALEHVLGDVSTGHMPEFLASTFDGNWDVLYSLVTNQDLNEYLRAAVINAYVVLYTHDLMFREQILAIFSNLFKELYDDRSYVLTKLVRKCDTIHATELSEQIEKCFDDGVIEFFFVNRESVKKSFFRSRAEAFAKMKVYPEYDFIDDLEKVMGWMFRDNN